MGYNYSFKTEKENSAKAVGASLDVSTKIAIEICNLLRKKEVESAKRILNDTIKMQRPIPLRRFTGDVGHKKGMGAGRFPQKACQIILSILESAESNAKFKGLGKDLIIVHINAQNAGNQIRYGRRNRNRKNTHLEIILQEITKKKEKRSDKAKTEPKKDTKEDIKIGSKEGKPKIENKKPDVKAEEKKEISEEKSLQKQKPEEKPKEEQKPEEKKEEKPKQEKSKPELVEKSGEKVQEKKETEDKK